MFGIFVFKLELMFEFVYIMIILIEIIGMMVLRIIRRIMSMFGYWLRLKILYENGVRILVIGVGFVGEMVVKEIYKNKSLNNIIIGFIDDDKEKVGR